MVLNSCFAIVVMMYKGSTPGRMHDMLGAPGGKSQASINGMPVYVVQPLLDQSLLLFLYFLMSGEMSIYGLS